PAHRTNSGAGPDGRAARGTHLASESATQRAPARTIGPVRLPRSAPPHLGDSPVDAAHAAPLATAERRRALYELAHGSSARLGAAPREGERRSHRSAVRVRAVERDPCPGTCPPGGSGAWRADPCTHHDVYRGDRPQSARPLREVTER